MRLTLEEARSRLKVDKHNLDGELEVQSAMLEAIGRRLAEENTALARAKRDLEAAEDLALDRLISDEPTLTNPQRERKIRRAPEFIKAHDAYISQKEVTEMWEALHKAWFNRGFDMRALAELFASQYFSETTVSLDAKTRVRQEENVRLLMREAHASVNEKRARRRIHQD